LMECRLVLAIRSRLLNSHLQFVSVSLIWNSTSEKWRFMPLSNTSTFVTFITILKTRNAVTFYWNSVPRVLCIMWFKPAANSTNSKLPAFCSI
jgi:hypothetical protein